ncbi:hypothetical protein ZWY2020_046730, partial [Hordeum vulgare]
YLSGPVDGGDDPGVAHLEESRAVSPGDDADLVVELPHLRDAGREESEPAELEPDEGEREGAGAHLVGASPVDAESGERVDVLHRRIVSAMECGTGLMLQASR